MNIEYRTSNTKDLELRTDSFLLRSATCVLCSVFCLLSVTGCQNSNQTESMALQIEQLTREKAQLEEQVDQSKTENEKLKEQLQVLSGLPEDVKLENLYSLQRIKIGRHTGFFDKDKDGKREKLIVYVQPVDEEGDGIKATGAAHVQLWDLNNPSGEALLGEWDVTSSELRNIWFKTILTVNYRLTFDLPETVESLDRLLTVKVTFTDHLSGRIFKDQKTIKPRPQ